MNEPYNLLFIYFTIYLISIFDYNWFNTTIIIYFHFYIYTYKFIIYIG